MYLIQINIDYKFNENQLEIIRNFEFSTYLLQDRPKVFSCNISTLKTLLQPYCKYNLFVALEKYCTKYDSFQHVTPKHQYLGYRVFGF